jgi:hypothetical protein
LVELWVDFVFFSWFSCPRWGLTLIWKPKHLQKLTILIYDLKRMRTWENETNCWWLSAFFWCLDWTATAIIDALSAQQNFADNPPWEPMVDTGSHLTVGIYCKLFRLCSLGEANSMRNSDHVWTLITSNWACCW